MIIRLLAFLLLCLLPGHLDAMKIRFKVLWTIFDKSTPDMRFSSDRFKISLQLGETQQTLTTGPYDTCEFETNMEKGRELALEVHLNSPAYHHHIGFPVNPRKFTLLENKAYFVPLPGGVPILPVDYHPYIFDQPLREIQFFTFNSRLAPREVTCEEDGGGKIIWSHGFGGKKELNIREKVCQGNKYKFEYKFEGRGEHQQIVGCGEAIYELGFLNRFDLMFDERKGTIVCILEEGPGKLDAQMQPSITLIDGDDDFMRIEEEYKNVIENMKGGGKKKNGEEMARDKGKEPIGGTIPHRQYQVPLHQMDPKVLMEGVFKLMAENKAKKEQQALGREIGRENVVDQEAGSDSDDSVASTGRQPERRENPTELVDLTADTPPAIEQNAPMEVDGGGGGGGGENVMVGGEGGSSATNLQRQIHAQSQDNQLKVTATAAAVHRLNQSGQILRPNMPVYGPQILPETRPEIQRIFQANPRQHVREYSAQQSQGNHPGPHQRWARTSVVSSRQGHVPNIPLVVGMPTNSSGPQRSLPMPGQHRGSQQSQPNTGTQHTFGPPQRDAPRRQPSQHGPPPPPLVQTTLGQQYNQWLQQTMEDNSEQILRVRVGQGPSSGVRGGGQAESSARAQLKRPAAPIQHQISQNAPGASSGGGQHDRANQGMTRPDLLEVNPLEAGVHPISVPTKRQRQVVHTIVRGPVLYQQRQQPSVQPTIGPYGSPPIIGPQPQPTQQKQNSSGQAIRLTGGGTHSGAGISSFGVSGRSESTTQGQAQQFVQNKQKPSTSTGYIADIVAQPVRPLISAAPRFERQSSLTMLPRVLLQRQSSSLSRGSGNSKSEGATAEKEIETNPADDGNNIWPNLLAPSRDGDGDLYAITRPFAGDKGKEKVGGQSSMNTGTTAEESVSDKEKEERKQKLMEEIKETLIRLRKYYERQIANPNINEENRDKLREEMRKMVLNYWKKNFEDEDTQKGGVSNQTPNQQPQSGRRPLRNLSDLKSIGFSDDFLNSLMNEN